MPEGPEIRRAADRVAAVLVGQPIEKVAFGLPHLAGYAPRLAGRVVTGVETRGKAMLTAFDNGLTIYSHNQLYGRWYTVRRPDMPKTGRQLRIELCTPTHRALLYSASDIDVLDARQLRRHPFLRRVGPDILDPDLTRDEIVARLAAAGFRRRALASLYLDQKFLAGNGNYLRSEILWAACADPGSKPCTLETETLERIATETLRISRRSYRTGGVTVAPALAKSLRAEGQGYREYRFFVFGREGLPCRRCGSPIRRETMAGRNVFLCPTCQLPKR